MLSLKSNKDYTVGSAVYFCTIINNNKFITTSKYYEQEKDIDNIVWRWLSVSQFGMCSGRLTQMQDTRTGRMSWTIYLTKSAQLTVEVQKLNVLIQLKSGTQNRMQKVMNTSPNTHRLRNNWQSCRQTSRTQKHTQKWCNTWHSSNPPKTGQNSRQYIQG